MDAQEDIRIKAWLYNEWWEYSPVGRAKVNEKFEFEDVNEQLCIYLGVTKAELIGKKFTDITPEPIATIDAENARMIMEGKIDRYELPKIYKISKNAQPCYVLLKVLGARNEKGGFKFFDVKILEIGEEDYLRKMKMILKNHVLLPGQTESKYNILQGLLRTCSVKDLIELGWKVALLAIMIWLAKRIPNERIPEFIEKFLQ